MVALLRVLQTKLFTKNWDVLGRKSKSSYETIEIFIKYAKVVSWTFRKYVLRFDSFRLLILLPPHSSNRPHTFRGLEIVDVKKNNTWHIFKNFFFIKKKKLVNMWKRSSRIYSTWLIVCIGYFVFKTITQETNVPPLKRRVHTFFSRHKLWSRSSLYDMLSRKCLQKVW